MADQQRTASTSMRYPRIKRFRGWDRSIVGKIRSGEKMAVRPRISLDAVLKLIEKLEQL